MTKKSKNTVKLTKKGYERILLYLEMARPNNLDSQAAKDIDEEIVALQYAVAAILQQ